MESNFVIVCVDDDLDVLDVTIEMLEHFKHPVMSFSEPKKAIEYIRLNRKNILAIVSDLKMAGTDGLELKAEIQRYASDIPYVIVTGFWDKALAESAMKVGVNAFLEKPITADVLQKQLAHFIADRNLVLLEEQELVKGFVDESMPILLEIEALILELEENHGQEQTLSVYFRLLHTIKGTASSVGLINLADFTHKYEDFIGELRSHRIPCNTQSINILLQGLDVLKKSFSSVEQTCSDTKLDLKDEMAIFIWEQTKSENGRPAEETSHDQANAGGDKKSDDKLSVSMQILNEFMEESGELTVIRNSILKTAKKIESKYRGDQDLDILSSLLQGMYEVTSNIQNKITQMRKVKLAQTFRPYKRLVRDISKQLGKQVDIEFHGDELAVDTVVAKLLSTTMIHIVRNSCDHGIESVEKRIAANKKPNGTLKISASETGENIVILVEDDGKGIDPKIIKSKALEKGLYSKEILDQMSEQQIVNIIFDSGFSTAEVVSDLSGRGVGMDMVRSSFQAMGGAVSVSSRSGEGSRFELLVPIPKSVLIIDALLVQVGTMSFLFPMHDVVEVVRYTNESSNMKIHQIDNCEVLIQNEVMIPILELNKLLNIPADKGHNIYGRNIVVLSSGSFLFGMAVDKIHEFEQVVSRKLTKQIDNTYVYAGATLLGTGEVGMILSSAGLATLANMEKLKAITKQQGHNKVAAEDIPTIDLMQFAYAKNKWLAIPLDRVVRLEKFDSKNLQTVGRNVIIKYRDELLNIVDPAYMLGLIEHNNMLELVKHKESKSLEVIVVKSHGMQFALYVESLFDIVKGGLPLDESTIDIEGLLGSVYHNNKTLCVADIDYFYVAMKSRRFLSNSDDMGRLKVAA